MPTTRDLKWSEIVEVFDSWRTQASDHGNWTILLWNQLLNDLRMKAENPPYE